MNRHQYSLGRRAINPFTTLRVSRANDAISIFLLATSIQQLSLYVEWFFYNNIYAENIIKETFSRISYSKFVGLFFLLQGKIDVNNIILIIIILLY